jgi:hypothetical protein
MVTSPSRDCNSFSNHGSHYHLRCGLTDLSEPRQVLGAWKP